MLMTRVLRFQIQSKFDKSGSIIPSTKEKKPYQHLAVLFKSCLNVPFYFYVALSLRNNETFLCFKIRKTKGLNKSQTFSLSLNI